MKLPQWVLVRKQELELFASRGMEDSSDVQERLLIKLCEELAAASEPGQELLDARSKVEGLEEQLVIAGGEIAEAKAEVLALSQRVADLEEQVDLQAETVRDLEHENQDLTAAIADGQDSEISKARRDGPLWGD
jgi:chromosome segregation ATPase